MKKSLLSSLLRPALTLTAICAAITLALAAANAVTEGPIAQRAAQTERDAMAELLPADEYQPVDTGDPEITCYRAVGGEKPGYIFVTAANGYGGEVSVMTAVYDEGTVAAIEILAADDETPGLGQNAKNPAFKEQFAGSAGPIEVVKDGSGGAGTGKVNAMTSATITSRAVAGAVNRALDAFAGLAEKGGADA